MRTGVVRCGNVLRWGIVRRGVVRCVDCEMWNREKWCCFMWNCESIVNLLFPVVRPRPGRPVRLPRQAQHPCRLKKPCTLHCQVMAALRVVHCPVSGMEDPDPEEELKNPISKWNGRTSKRMMVTAWGLPPEELSFKVEEHQLGEPAPSFAEKRRVKDRMVGYDRSD